MISLMLLGAGVFVAWQATQHSHAEAPGNQAVSTLDPTNSGGPTTPTASPP
ncbi:MAG: hypothetical protein LBE83_10910 [Propionibacteriaceae bacterium]|nr:hypothetical protein [Propionibacteriaceae bacterium]